MAFFLVCKISKGHFELLGSLVNQGLDPNTLKRIIFQKTSNLLWRRKALGPQVPVPSISVECVSTPTVPLIGLYEGDIVTHRLQNPGKSQTRIHRSWSYPHTQILVIPAPTIFHLSAWAASWSSKMRAGVLQEGYPLRTIARGNTFLR